jgi:hypothetical protein
MIFLKLRLKFTSGDVCCVCCALSGRGLCGELITCSREVLPTVARRCEWSRNLVWRGGHNSFGTLQNKYTKFVASSHWNILKLCVTYLSQKLLSETRWEYHIEGIKFVWLKDRNFQASLAETENTKGDKSKGEIISIEQQLTNFNLMSVLLFGKIFFCQK